MLDDSLVKPEIASFPGDKALFCSVCRESPLILVLGELKSSLKENEKQHNMFGP